MATQDGIDQTARNMINQLKDRVDALERRLGVEPPPPPGAFDDFQPQDQYADIRDVARSGNMIEAIKMYRERTGLGLAEAKEAVERL